MSGIGGTGWTWKPAWLTFLGNEALTAGGKTHHGDAELEVVRLNADVGAARRHLEV